MPILFRDSFDHYATADILKKYNSITLTPEITASGRTGSGLLCTNGESVSSTLAAAQQTLTAGFAFKASVLPTTREDFLNIKDAGTNQVVFSLNPDGTIMAERAATTLSTTANSLAAGSWYYIQLKAYIHNTSGTVDILVNGVSWMSLTGQDTNFTGNNFVNSFTLRGPTSTNYFDDLYVTDGEYLGDIKILAAVPSGAGTTGQFAASAGSAYACVDDATPNGDTDYIYSAVVNDKSTFAMGDISALGTIIEVTAHVCGRNDDAGARSICPVVRTVSTDYDGDTAAQNTSYLYRTKAYRTNPNTGAAWTAQQVTDIEVGAKVVS